jgi:hypothetical protein
MKTKYALFSLLVASITFQLQAQVKHIRWGSSQGPLNNLTITWRNTGTTDSIDWGYTPSFEKPTSPGVKRAGYTDNLFNYVFATVTPSAVIYYKIYDSSTKKWGTQKQFRTAPDESKKEFSFAGIGDSRDGMAAWTKVSNQANGKYKTDFTVFNGDIVADGSNGSLWDSWFNAGSSYLENNLVLHALGNHDNTGVSTYLNNFTFPSVSGQSLYYAVTYANAIFITLNSEDPTNSAQATWLKNTLAAAKANPNIQWKVISFHRPFYTVGNHAGEMNSYFSTWWKAFDDNGVDLVLNGHDHMYERSKPINRNVSTTAPVTKYGSGATEGRCEIVCGGAGAPFYTGTANVFVEKMVVNKNHFCKLNVRPLPNGGSVLCDSTFDSDGNLIDNFCIEKPGTTGIDANNIVFNPMTIVPNPVTDLLTLQYQSPLKGQAVVKIFDINGKELLSRNVQKTDDLFEFKYEISGYAKGMYSIQITMEGQRDNALFVVQ